VEENGYDCRKGLIEFHLLLQLEFTLPVIVRPPKVNDFFEKSWTNCVQLRVTGKLLEKPDLKEPPLHVRVSHPAL
jgi:hypothetical protein